MGQIKFLLLLVAACGLFAFEARAETIAAAHGNYPGYYCQSYPDGQTTVKPWVQTAGTAYAQCTSWYGSSAYWSATGGICGAAGGGGQLCTVTGQNKDVYTCPQNQNWVLVGTTCQRPDCTSNQSLDPADGVCKGQASATCTPLNGGGNSTDATEALASTRITADQGSVAGTATRLPNSTAEQGGYSYTWTLYGGGTTCRMWAKPTSGSCIATGNIGSVAYYDSGSNAVPLSTDPPRRVACIGGCWASWVGTNQGGSYLVAGVRHYLSKGQYQYMGDGATCTVGTSGAVGGSMSMAGSSIPSSSCASGQTPVTTNGVTKCYTAAGAPVAETVAAPTKTTTRTTVTNGDGTKTITTRVCEDLTGNCESSVQTYGSGVTVPVLPTTETTPWISNVPGNPGFGIVPGSGGIPSSSSGSGTGTGAGMSEFCAANPTVEACKSITAGTAATVDSLYTADSSGKTFSASVTAFKNTLSSSGFYGAAGNFFSVGSLSGACSGLTATYTLFGHTTVLDASPYLCGSTAATFYSYLSMGLLLVATGIAFAIAIL